MLKQFTTTPTLSVTLCNSEHPLAKHIVWLSAKRIPGSTGMFFVKFVADRHVVTYREADRTIGIFNMSFAEFKQRWEAKTLPANDVYDVPDTDKHIANAIWRLIHDELV